jgi:hypothetical protein
MGQLRNACEVLVRTPELKKTLGRHGRSGRIILKLILKCVVEVWTELIWLRIGISDVFEHGNELSVPINGGEFLRPPSASQEGLYGINYFVCAYEHIKTHTHTRSASTSGY